MVNAYDIIKQKARITSIHDLLSYNGTVFCDSGGWQILQGRKDVNICEIIDVQRRLDADLYAVLDDGLNEERHFSYLAFKPVKIWRAFVFCGVVLLYAPLMPNYLMDLLKPASWASFSVQNHLSPSAGLSSISSKRGSPGT